MRKLRLLVTAQCNRRCKGCCNNDWDVLNLPEMPLDKGISKYDEILLTGGEPMLFPALLIDLIAVIREYTQAPIYLYTAKVDDIEPALRVFKKVDGFTVTLHTKTDLEKFNIFQSYTNQYSAYKSLRLNVFKGIEAPVAFMWEIKKNIRWIKNCPLPEGEEFRKLVPLWIYK